MTPPLWPRDQKLCERAWQLFGEAQYERLPAISISHESTVIVCSSHYGKARERRWLVSCSLGEDWWLFQNSRIEKPFFFNFIQFLDLDIVLY